MTKRKPESNQITREEVKTLAIAIGVREAARQTGINENTILSWSKRGKWFTDTIVPKPQTLIKQNGEAISAIKRPSNALQDTLNERKQSSRLNLSKYVEKASSEAAEHRKPLSITGKVKDVASIHSILWPEKEAAGSGVLPGLQVYSEQTVIQVGSAG